MTQKTLVLLSLLLSLSTSFSQTLEPASEEKNDSSMYNPEKILALSYLTQEAPKDSIDIDKDLPNPMCLYGNPVYGYFAVNDSNTVSGKTQLILPYIGSKIENEIHCRENGKFQLFKKYISQQKSPTILPHYQLQSKQMDAPFVLGSGATHIHLENKEVKTDNWLQFIYLMNKNSEIVWWHFPYIKSNIFHSDLYLKKLNNDIAYSAQNHSGEYFEIIGFNKLIYIQKKLNQSTHNSFFKNLSSNKVSYFKEVFNSEIREDKPTSFEISDNRIYFSEEKTKYFRDFKSFLNPLKVLRDSLFRIDLNSNNAEEIWKAPGQFIIEEKNYINKHRSQFSAQKEKVAFQIKKILLNKNTIYMLIDPPDLLIKGDLDTPSKMEKITNFSDNLIITDLAIEHDQLHLLSKDKGQFFLEQREGKARKIPLEYKNYSFNNNGDLLLNIEEQKATAFNFKNEKLFELSADNNKALSKNITTQDNLGSIMFLGFDLSKAQTKLQESSL